MNGLPPGTIVVGRYWIKRLLGEGATKVVYLAEDRLASTDVALLLLKSGRGTDPTLSARFSREGRAASVLRSPFTVRVFDVGKTDDGFRYMSTEAVLGRPLDAAIKYGAVDVRSAITWTMHVLHALGEAHAVGIVHRDVKPENILLSPTNEGEVARLTDWGLAKVLDLDLEGSFNLRTAQGVVLGTPDYMPPEQWQGIRLDGRTDIYATGVLLYELLSGATPFFAKEVHAICVRHMTQPVPALPSNVDPAARLYEPVIFRALSKRAEERYATAEAMRIALEAISGIRIEPGISEATRAPAPSRGVRVEIVGDCLPGTTCLVASPTVIIGRDPDAHVPVRFASVDAASQNYARTVSRRHARIDWRGGRGYVTDLSGGGGTRVGDRPVGAEPVEIRDGDTLSLGPIVRLRLETAIASPGILPGWARLVRTDPYGAGMTFVLVLTEASISSAPDAALRLPPEIAGDSVVRVRARDGDLAVISPSSQEPVGLRDGQVLRVGKASLHIAIART